MAKTDSKKGKIPACGLRLAGAWLWLAAGFGISALAMAAAKFLLSPGDIFAAWLQSLLASAAGSLWKVWVLAGVIVLLGIFLNRLWEEAMDEPGILSWLMVWALFGLLGSILDSLLLPMACAFSLGFLGLAIAQFLSPGRPVLPILWPPFFLSGQLAGMGIAGIPEWVGYPYLMLGMAVVWGVFQTGPLNRLSRMAFAGELTGRDALDMAAEAMSLLRKWDMR